MKELIICLVILVVIAVVFFYLGVLYGKEDEKIKWREMILKGLPKNRSPNWVIVLKIELLGGGKAPAISLLPNSHQTLAVYQEELKNKK